MHSHDVLELLGCAPEVAAALSDRARIQAMLDVEAALAHAEAACGVIPAAAVGPIAQAARAELYDLGELAVDARRSGNLAIPLVAQLTARVAATDATAAGYVHWGATSQDVIDTGLVLQLGRAAPAVANDLNRVADAAARHAREHVRTVMAGRTWLQQAAPVTFGLKAAGWLDAIDRVRHSLEASTRDALTLQFGGAAGTLAALGADGPRVVNALAGRLNVQPPALPWHAERSRLARLASDLGIAVGSLGKIARDLVLLAQTEVGEASEPAAAAGGSSSMPQKRNPVRAVLVLAAAGRAPALVASMLAAMPQEHERGAGGWHVEWDTLPHLVRLASVAAHSAAAALEALIVDPARMRINLDRAGGETMAEAVAVRLARSLGRAEAHAVVQAAIGRAANERRPFSEIIANTPQVTHVLSASELQAALAPEQNLGSAVAFVEAALAAHDEAVRKRNA
jgi:3-carboxy-cis,cis-muconate cycloisomerase